MNPPLGSQLATAIYSIIVFTYCGIVVGAMLGLAGRQFWQSYGIQRIPSGLLIIGTAAAIALCVIVIVMDIAHVTGNLELMHAIDPAYGMLSLLAFLFLCAGFAGQPVIRYLRDRTRHGATREMLTEIEPIWRRATRVRPGLSSTNALHATGTDPEGRLHRKIVEIRDAMIDPRVSFAVTQPELALLEYAEQHLLGNDIHDHRPSTLAPDCPKPEAGHPS